jgi:hypothetical protein
VRSAQNLRVAVNHGQTAWHRTHLERT